MKEAKDMLYSADWIEFYDRLMPEKHYRDSFRNILRLIRQYSPSARNVLELACGTGRYTKYFVKHRLNVEGIDISYPAISLAKKRVKNTKFRVADMSKIKYNSKYDIVACLFESFRYHTSFSQAQRTLDNCYDSLRPNGVFLCDFGVFPASTRPVQLHNKVRMKDGRVVIKDESILTKGNFDTRSDYVTVLRGSKVIYEGTVRRSPLLRIPDNKMKYMLDRAGFKKIKALKNVIPDSPRTKLFIGQKI
ncbi:MAG: methyltransferase domain-containing protein [Nanoarchaeota archaeon]